MYKFKYHNDLIMRNDRRFTPFAKFMILNPNFPIQEGQFFEYRENGELDNIINGNHHKIENLEDYQTLIEAIDSLGE